VTNIINKKVLKETYERLVTEGIDREYLYSWNTIPYTLLSILAKTEQKSIKVLELGCGRGQLSNYLTAKGFDVIATDFNIVSLKIGRQMHPNLQLICADAEELPFRESEYDVIISVELIEHLPDVATHLEEVRRVLKKDGRYYLSTPNKLVESAYNLFRKRAGDELHISSQSILSLKRILIESGFEPMFYPSKRFTSAQLRKIGCSQTVSSIARKFPLIIVPKMFQPSLTCVAKKR